MTILDYTGLYKTIQDYTGLYRTIKDYSVVYFEQNVHNDYD